MRKRWAAFAIVATVVILACGGFLSFLFSRNAPHAAAWSEIGDAFGVLNTLFSGLAFAGVVVALYLQMEELALQREEMKNSREELAKTAAAQAKQVDLIAQQLGLAAKVSEAEAAQRIREIAPQFRCLGLGKHDYKGIRLRVRNEGGLAKDLRAVPAEKISFRFVPPGPVAREGELEMRLLCEGDIIALFPQSFSCADVDGNAHTFVIDREGGGSSYAITRRLEDSGVR